MNQPLYALVVDDETPLRRLTVHALEQCGFECDEAADGEQAADLVARRHYDVIVTDLRMPKNNGHSFAVKVLEIGERRPLLVVLTGVLEPRMAKDLIARGVDDITFKPVDFRAFGAKVQALWLRRQKQSLAATKACQFPAAVTDPPLGTPTLTEKWVRPASHAPASSTPTPAVAVDVPTFMQDGAARVTAGVCVSPPFTPPQIS